VDRKSFSLKIKSVAEDGSFVGVASTYGDVDLGGDRILPGAFNRTLAATKQFPLLWQHIPSEPIGSVKCTDTPQGLQVEGQLLLSDPTAQKCYKFLKAGIIKGLSIGYQTIKSNFVDDVRELSELRLWEVSCVTFPMNLDAAVTGIKSMSDEDRATHFKAIDRHRKSIDRAQRGIREHMKALFDGLDDEDVDDPDVLEADDDEQDPENEGRSMVLAELKSLAAAAEELSEV
jgi:HK97 family phage prohead protease